MGGKETPHDSNCGYLKAISKKTALEKVAAKLAQKGYEGVIIDYGLDTVFFWAYSSPFTISPAPFIGHCGYSSHYVSVSECLPFNL